MKHIHVQREFPPSPKFLDVGASQISSVLNISNVILLLGAIDLGWFQYTSDFVIVFICL